MEFPVTHAVTHAGGAFEIRQDGRRIAWISYARIDADRVVAEHTVIDPSLRGHGVAAVLLDAASRIRLVRAGHRCTLNVPVGTTVSLLPWGHDAVVTATGVRWPLHRETLAAGTSRGISNVATATSVDIDVERGMLLVGDGDGR